MRRLKQFLIGIVIFAAAAPLGWTHGGVIHQKPPDAWWRLWSWEPGSVIAVAAAAWFYFRGWRRLKATSPQAVARRHRSVLLYACGWLILAVALLSPIHPLGQYLFSVHMVQHELLMVGAAPLLILGRPGSICLLGLPRSARRTVSHVLTQPAVRRCWQTLSNPFVAWVIHASALWLWHAPVLFEATLHHPWVHAAQHASFLLSALLFWHAVFYGPQRRAGYGLAVVNLFTTAIHSGVLGALITFAASAWYPSYRETSGAWGLSALEDQQLGGLIMWVPSGLVYVVAGLALFAGWVRESERTTAVSPAAPAETTG